MMEDSATEFGNFSRHKARLRDKSRRSRGPSIRSSRRARDPEESTAFDDRSAAGARSLVKRENESRVFASSPFDVVADRALTRFLALHLLQSRGRIFEFCVSLAAENHGFPSPVEASPLALRSFALEPSSSG